MEIRQLRYFEAVVRHRHFTRAADELHIAQSALSHQVRRLDARPVAGDRVPHLSQPGFPARLF